jgi:hypothetical protein
MLPTLRGNFFPRKYQNNFLRLLMGMELEVQASLSVTDTPSQGAKVASVSSPEDLADAAMRRLRAEIIDKFGDVKSFAPLLEGTISYYGLNDNLAGRTDMKLMVLYKCLDVLGMDQAEFARRVLADSATPRP